jgi:predicted nuclease of predicted toxin-antitoxin system
MATFFFDNDISFRIVHALRELVHDHELIALRDRFPLNAKDTEWIPEAGKNGWVVISRDFNQRRRDSEHQALRKNKVKAIYIRQSGNPADLYADAARIIKQWPKIQAWGLNAKPGTLARLDTSDRILTLK